MRAGARAGGRRLTMPAGNHHARVAGKVSQARPRRDGAGKLQVAPPPAAPPLSAMDERRQKLEAERTVQHAALKEALRVTEGNVSQAAAKLAITRDRANRLIRRLGLVDWSASLRVANTGHSRGRQDR